MCSPVLEDVINIAGASAYFDNQANSCHVLALFESFVDELLILLVCAASPFAPAACICPLTLCRITTRRHETAREAGGEPSKGTGVLPAMVVVLGEVTGVPVLGQGADHAHLGDACMACTIAAKVSQFQDLL
jgi:hypothetical protein